MLEMIWTSFVQVVAPVLGTLVGLLLLALLTKLLKSLGLSVDQKQMAALTEAAINATTAVEAWAAKKQAENAGVKPSSKEKLEKAVTMVKAFLSNNSLYAIADDKIIAAIESMLGANVVDLQNLAASIRRERANKAPGGN